MVNVLRHRSGLTLVVLMPPHGPKEIYVVAAASGYLKTTLLLRYPVLYRSNGCPFVGMHGRFRKLRVAEGQLLGVSAHYKSQKDGHLLRISIPYSSGRHIMLETMKKKTGCSWVRDGVFLGVLGNPESGYPNHMVRKNQGSVSSQLHAYCDVFA